MSSNKKRDPLRVVAHAQGFHFYTAIGDYCGVSAHSLEEFANALRYVCSDARVFHFERGDFQKWIRDVIGDAELAQTMDDIKMCGRHLSAESCRKELVDALCVRILQLEVQEGPSCIGCEIEK
jgi:alpha-amylase